jgi:FKBP-type peptidyl-prolyl cis-trans isomerase
MAASSTKAQRIGIWIIAIVMTVGTLGSFMVIALSNDNQKIDKTRTEKLLSDYQAKYAEYSAKAQAQGDELSKQYYESFNQYATLPAAFNKDDVKELVKTDIKLGDGSEIKEGDSFTAYYIGWNPTGEVFDGSIDSGKLKAPFTAQPGGVIKGWTEGVLGMKIGGVRELTIPSNLAYGANGSGEKIPANTPLKFVIMIIPTPELIAQPEVPAELLKYYSKGTL